MEKTSCLFQLIRIFNKKYFGSLEILQAQYLAWGLSSKSIQHPSLRLGNSSHWQADIQQSVLYAERCQPSQ